MVEISEKFKYAPLIVFQVILLILYFIFTTYGGADDVGVRGYEDTHVMIFIGFGFLMTFLKKYCYSALGFNWLLAAMVIQWALLCQNFFHMEDMQIRITKKLLLEADIMSATVLITFGALLGLTSGPQLLFIAIIETALGCTNLYLCEAVFQVSDIGGSIAIHTFGAYFGLGVSAALRMKKVDPPQGVQRLDGPSYVSDTTAMIGSIFLWIYWPSFNSALSSSDAEYQRAVVNTYLSLAAATVTAFIVSSIVNHEAGKFDMVHVQNSTLAGGVGVGAVANFFISPGAAIAIGIGAGVLSVCGYKYLTPAMEKFGIQDTCGVNNLHGMPGVYSGLLSVFFAFFITSETYGSEMEHIFEAMGEGRSAGVQALFQLAALITTMVLAIGVGFGTGIISKAPIFSPLKETERYDDKINWELP
ncbi:ammonium transporter Rh type B [Trichoplusia ni]|uniref:Ammonium transporter Rh type B n=1 Tax=Trichoplusia ni TaxID=7111 RepID=A0A7E5VQB5_TRINI|nr:ammonium transporter Rh type B [Trichoplusia ni]XP_026730520.1 ammonium transporter Rh type B [Trichoplusia ni]XP_026730521.1 ammonium transporter Rh type B [Trichoplusia ni]